MSQPDYVTPLTSYGDDGRIIANHTVPQSMRNLQVGRFIDGHFDTATHYVQDGGALPRPPCPAALAGSTLSGMPVPATLFINDQPFDVTEDTATLAFPNPGVYRLRLVCWPYLDGIFDVEQ